MIACVAQRGGGVLGSLVSLSFSRQHPARLSRPPSSSRPRSFTRVPLFCTFFQSSRNLSLFCRLILYIDYSCHPPPGQSHEPTPQFPPCPTPATPAALANSARASSRPRTAPARLPTIAAADRPASNSSAGNGSCSSLSMISKRHACNSAKLSFASSASPPHANLGPPKKHGKEGRHEPRRLRKQQAVRDR